MKSALADTCSTIAELAPWRKWRTGQAHLRHLPRDHGYAAFATFVNQVSPFAFASNQLAPDLRPLFRERFQAKSYFQPGTVPTFTPYRVCYTMRRITEGSSADNQRQSCRRTCADAQRHPKRPRVTTGIPLTTPSPTDRQSCGLEAENLDS
jgi:hypothetical protein